MKQTSTQAPLIVQASTTSRMRQLQIRSIVGAGVIVLLLRIVLGLWALPISATYPMTPLEEQVSVMPGDAPLADWLQRVLVMPWYRYDADWYTRIVDQGYRPGAGTAAFHPLYPLLAMPLSWLLGGNTPLALLIVSTLATIALCVVFARYVEQAHGSEFMQPAAWLLLVGPPSFIMLAPYNEGLFLALAVCSLWALHHERWWLAGLLGGLAALTRQQGLALALPLFWMVLMAWRAGRARWWDIGAVALIPLGYALFVLYRALALGDATALNRSQNLAEFLRTLLVSNSSEQVVIGQRLAWPWEPLFAQIHSIFTATNSYDLVIDLLLGIAFVLVLALGWRGMTVAERLYTLTIVLLTLCYYNGVLRPYLSMPRHLLLAFPIFIILARWAKGGRRLRILIEVFWIVDLFLAGLYVRNGWIP